jgi:Domain of unknown function (DUF4136)
MRKAATVLGTLFCALVLGCSTMTTAVDYDHTINWGQFHTFQIMTGTPAPTTFTQKRIDNAISSALASKGWTAVTSNPDIEVYPHVVLSQQKQWTATSMGGWGYRGWGGMGGMTTATQTNIPIGTLIVDLVNPATKEMVWRGQAQDQISGGGKDQGKLDQAMQAMFKDFPPGSATKS